VDSFGQDTGAIAEEARAVGIRASVGCPIVVGGHLWGVIAASKREEPFPPDTEAQLGEFTELVATAVANAEAHAELMASRARIVATADETRRRIERDLHDGAQQHLVSLALRLQGAAASIPSQLDEIHQEITVGEAAIALILRSEPSGSCMQGRYDLETGAYWEGLGPHLVAADMFPK